MTDFGLGEVRVDIPTEAPAEVLAFNQALALASLHLPKIHEVGPKVARQAREEGKSVFGALVYSDRAFEKTVDGPSRPLRFRVMPPAGPPRGVFFHIHGGGWVLGGAHHHDPMLQRLADATGLTVVSTYYRLAPENPYPAGPDDCEAAALWLHRNARQAFGAQLVAIGGESAGAHLAAVTCIRLRDRHGLNPFRAALLTYGAYDLRGTPSVREAGEETLILTTTVIRWFTEQFARKHDLNDPDISPIFAGLEGLPPALFTVGTIDPLYDDSLFMFIRWRKAGNHAELAIWPEAIHAFDYFDNEYGRAARDRMHSFLRRILG
ncbi:MAG: alpha/beta hydrolase [Actinomycetia bacterium]|nr:alpha/beta hydrolase [Actinomycetes bacterium]